MATVRDPTDPSFILDAVRYFGKEGLETTRWDRFFGREGNKVNTNRIEEIVRDRFPQNNGAQAPAAPSLAARACKIAAQVGGVAVAAYLAYSFFCS